MHQSHAIRVVFGAFTPGNHVNTDGFELSSAQNHRIYGICSISRTTPQRTSIFTQFLQCCDMFVSRSKFVTVKAL